MISCRSYLRLAVLVAVGCGNHAMAPAAPPVAIPFPALTSDGAHFRDASGRMVLLHGVNARVDGLFDVTFSDGRQALEPIPTFDAGDAAAMRQLGLNLLRLPINWSAVEPQPGVFDTAYLDRVAAIVGLCRAQHIWVLIDLHQDAYSKEIGEDGAPLWAILPAPAMLLGGPLTSLELTLRRGSADVSNAFDSLFVSDTGMLQESYATMLQTVAQRFAKDETVIGFDIFNEPNYALDDSQVLPFDAKMAQALRSVDTTHLIAFEPSAQRNSTDRAMIATTPFSVAHAVYAPHVYTDVSGDGTAIADGSFAPALAASVHAARVEADAWGTPLFVGEYGVSPAQANATGWLDAFHGDADAELASYALWLWKEESQGNWGLFDHAPSGAWTLRAAYAAAIARPYAQAIDGTITSMGVDGKTLTVTFTATSGGSGLHEIFQPADTVHATCDGKAAVARATTVTRVFQIACAGAGTHTLVVTP